MAVCRIEKNKNYTTMSNFHLRDRNLSNKARGLLSTMLSLPDDWDYTTRGLASICKDGVDSITAQLKELEACGYLVRRRRRDECGRLCDVEYIIYEEPQISEVSDTPDTDLPDTDSPHTENPYMDNPYTENAAQLNIDKLNTKKQNTDFTNIVSLPSEKTKTSGAPTHEAKEPETNYDSEAYRELIKNNIDYDILCSDMPHDQDRLDEIVELIVETISTTKKYIRVSGADFPTEVVRSRLLKLTGEHIRFVFDCLDENTTKVRNMKQYLLTTLYNAPVTMENYYSSLVRHDLYAPHARE